MTNFGRQNFNVAVDSDAVDQVVDDLVVLYKQGFPIFDGTVLGCEKQHGILG